MTFFSMNPLGIYYRCHAVWSTNLGGTALRPTSASRRAQISFEDLATFAIFRLPIATSTRRTRKHLRISPIVSTKRYDIMNDNDYTRTAGEENMNPAEAMSESKGKGKAVESLSQNMSMDEDDDSSDEETGAEDVSSSSSMPSSGCFFADNLHRHQKVIRLRKTLE